MPQSLHLTCSLADQNVRTTKSIGIFNFSTRVTRALAEHPRVAALSVLGNPTLRFEPPLPERVRYMEHTGAVRHRLGRMLWDQLGVYRAARREGHPWLLLPKGFASFLARPPVPLAAYVHDIMGHFYRAKYPGFESRLEFEYFARSLDATLRDARVLFTNTSFTRGEILSLARRRGLPEPRQIVVAGYGFDAPPAREPEPRTDTLLLFASKVPHKRTDLALRFLEHWLARRSFSGRVVCIGILSDTMARPTGPAWQWLGRVPPDEARRLIHQARAIVYTSEYEGFGMPPIEAVLEGTCPVYSDIPPIREAMGGAGFAFANDSADGFVAALDQALLTPPDQVQAWREALLARHAWPKVVDAMVEALTVPANHVSTPVPHPRVFPPR